MNLDQQQEFYTPDAEQQLLGALLTDNDKLSMVGDFLLPEHFFDPVHRRIYEVIRGRVAKGHLASPVTLKVAMENDEGLKELGGPKYLGRLAGASVAGYALRDYAKVVVQDAARRTLQGAAQEAMNGLTGGGEPQEVALRLMHALQSLPEDAGQESSISLMKAMTEAVAEAKEIYEGTRTFFKTGVRALDEIIKGLAPGDFCLIGGTTSMGKAQPLTSRVLTPSGWAEMGELKVGDEVCSSDGSHSVVEGVFPQGWKKIYRVELSDGRSVRCCGDHLWEVSGSFFGHRVKVLSTDDLREKLGMKTARGRITLPLFGGDFGGGGLPIDPWLLGAFLGNGYFADPGNPMFSTSDASTLWRFTEALGDEHEVVLSAGYDYRVKSKDRTLSKFALNLAGLGLRGCRAETKFIPEIYLKACLADRVKLLQGLLDTDGWVEKFGAVRFSTSSKMMALQVQDLVRSIGGTCTLSSKMPKYEHAGEKRIGQEHFVLNVRHNDPEGLFTVPQKKRRAERKRKVSLTIKSITEDGFEDAQCIKVSHPRALYVTDGFTMTHNTTLALEIAKNAAFRGNEGVAFISLEMTPQQLATRIASSFSRVPYAALRDAGSMSEKDFEAWCHGARQAAFGALRVVPKHVRDVPAIHAACKRIDGEFGQVPLSLVVIDYMQLARAGGAKRFEQMTEVSIQTKHMAAMLGVPVIGLVQLSRDIGHREDKRPKLNDIKETGQFENDADQVIFCHREQYWLERQGPALDKSGQVTTETQMDWQADLEACRNRMEAIAAKNRHGPLATAEIGCHMPTARFWDLQAQEEMPL